MSQIYLNINNQQAGPYDVDGVKGIDEEGIRIAVYEDLKDTLNIEFSDVIY